MIQTYIHDGIEVIKTGREAIRKLRGGTAELPRILLLVEITPLDQNTGDWKRWIDPTQLYEVQTQS